MNAPRSFPRDAFPEEPLRARKSLGQNFLVDPNAIRKIVDACAFQKDDYVLEIGPGTGALTREIIPRVGNFLAVETDGRLWKKLTGEFTGPQVQIVHADFLKFDLHQISLQLRSIKAFGNLPYYISTPIITKIIEHRSLFSEFYLTVQWEFAQRMVAQPGGKDYSSFSCFVQFFTQPQILFKIKNTCFRPVPKVDSCFLKLTMRKKPLYDVGDEDFLFRMIRLGFQQRRKTFVNALSTLAPKDQLLEILKSVGLAPAARAESLDIKQFVALANVLSPRMNT